MGIKHNFKFRSGICKRSICFQRTQYNSLRAIHLWSYFSSFIDMVLIFFLAVFNVATCIL